MNSPYNKTGLAVLLSVIALQGCAQNQSFAPPINGESLHFTATLPQELASSPIYAVYRSEICRKENRTSNMEVYTVPGYYRKQYPLTMNASNQLEANIPQSGGGKCDWKLSNFVFEVTLKDPSKIDPLISDNLGKKISFVLDNNAPATFDGGYEKKSGDFNETLTLFPLITEDFIGGHEMSFWLIAKYETMTYKVKKANNINVNIDYKANMKTYSIGPKNKNEDSIATFIYPNGEQEKTKWLFPEYKKLIAISESMTQK
ncbi:hypothetical protein U2T78_000120 [Providencia stuartii]|uniref:Lipoprotein n=1 Tax=Providencia stuartii TaxID=588 RepID=A0AAJ1JEH6_PROST|nr:MULTISPECIES: hypothetical protein [Providencia]EMA3639499.1 hypothetical protein [Providencia stuartii]MBW3099814.1 hypothetical protein [Providencia stuartii]MCB5216255.1 hypothetical protein [Providencia stuartii]MDE8749977.1 hypothetical protein [Providencia thailandensis]MDE8769637.1 hypothetical protein [Providencia thailandensis]